jgi:protein-tyrosine phosphatase
MMDSFNTFIYKNIQKLKSETNLSIFNVLTNNNDIVFICPNLYLGNTKSINNIELLTKYNIDSIVNCTNDIPIHHHFNNKPILRVDIEDSKDIENIEKFKSRIIHATYFIDAQIKQNKNVIVHCYWGIMRSPTIIASYLIYKYKMDVDGAIEFIKDKKNFCFNNIYNFKEILYYVKEEFNKVNDT